MRPRFSSDYRSFFWALVLFPLGPGLVYFRPALAPWLLPLQLYLSYCAGVLTHNQTHCAVFSGRNANAVYAAWLSIFYGCPIAAWIPTHLLNHHRFPNRARDVTRTDRLSERHDLWQALRYTLACGAWQLPLVLEYARRQRARGGRHWQELCLQLCALALAHASLAALALALHGATWGAAAYLSSVALPALLAPHWMFFTNYLQHVHCDAASSDDYCRNFVSPFANWWVFQNGYHTVHHDHPQLHWSLYPGLHAERAARIHPSLQVRSWIGFCVENYLLGSFSRRFGTRPLRSVALSARPR